MPPEAKGKLCGFPGELSRPIRGQWPRFIPAYRRAGKGGSEEGVFSGSDQKQVDPGIGRGFPRLLRARDGSLLATTRVGHPLSRCSISGYSGAFAGGRIFKITLVSL